MKDALRGLFLGTLQELSLDRVIHERVKVESTTLLVDDTRIDLSVFKKIIIIALGKAAAQMTASMKDVLSSKTVSGIVVSPDPVTEPLPYMLYYQGGHPYPNRESVRAADVILELLQQLNQDHLVIYLLSGGGSAIVEKPIDPAITLEDLRQFYRVLVTCGANIVEINTLRKHFSAVKGGRLAEAAHPAHQLTLYVSDVPPDKPSMVASGPTMPDESTVADCQEIVKRYDLLPLFPKSIRDLFERGAIAETPKPGSSKFKRSSWHVLLSTEQGVEKIEDACRHLGWTIERDLSVDDRPVTEAAGQLLTRLRSERSRHPGKTVAVVTGGELSSPVTGTGVGGRNLAFALACAERIGGENIAVISAGTDGIDGNSPAAGAVADGETLRRAERLGMDAADFFRRSDSYTFFAKLGDALVTGPTGNNVRDLRLLVAW